MKTRKRKITLLVLLCGLLCLYAFQNPVTGFRLLRSFFIEAKYIQTDRLGNLFVVNKTNQLYKFSSEGKPLSTLNYKYLGNITQVDPTNPLEVYVFYKELNTVLFLDNNLAYRGEINLSNQGIGQASAVARAYDNGVWVFDIADLQLKKMSKAGEILQVSGNVKQFVSANVAPNYIYDDNKQVYVNDSANGILVFDVFASYVKTIPIKGCDDFKIIDDELFYNAGSSLVKYNLKTHVVSPFMLPDTSERISQLSIEKERLYLMKPDSIDIYSFR